MPANHYSAPLSQLDLEMARSVPPGGNWKDIPLDVPSKRLDQIRSSYAAGLGSRSTYYGRLLWDRPAYTINTYFNRPGNGCHLHPDYDGGQHRTLSQREAARIQSFPDAFIFKGSRTSIYNQIGNAVPPLLAHRIAGQLGTAGRCLDLFCGAGGLALGFQWAGWKPVLGVDSEKRALETYGFNVHPEILCGDLSQHDVIEGVVRRARENGWSRRSRDPLWIIGGPPCQGFSTAGNRRSMKDSRNQLFKAYAEVLGRLQPDGFVFENVAGLLSMERGQVHAMVVRSLEDRGYVVQTWDVKAHEYGLPQRRRRVFLVGVAKGNSLPVQPERDIETNPNLFDSKHPQILGVQDAIGDLAPLAAGEDGSELKYYKAAACNYQSLMRDEVALSSYLSSYRTAAHA